MLLQSSPVITDTVVQPRLISLEDLKKITKKIKESPTLMGLDTETTGLDIRSCLMVALQFGTKKHVYILDCRPFYALNKEDQSAFKSAVKAFLETVPTFIGQNLKYDWQVLNMFCGARMDSVIDCMLQEKLLIGGMRGQRASLQALGEKYHFVVEDKEGNHSWFQDLNQKPEWYKPFPQDQLLYMARDITVPLAVNDLQQQELTRLGLNKIAKLENSCLPAFGAMGVRGMLVDIPKWKGIIERKSEQRDALQREVEAFLTPSLRAWTEKRNTEEKSLKTALARDYSKLVQMGKAPMSFDVYVKEKMEAWKKKNGATAPNLTEKGQIKLTSHRQILWAFRELGLPVMTTQAEELAIHKAHPAIEKYLIWRELETFIANNGDKSILSWADTEGRIHPNWQQIGTDTGRSACTEPNMQKLPSEDEDHPEDSVRRAIIAPEGYILLDCDFPNIEPRTYADWSNDPNLLAVFASGKNMHAETARIMFNLDPAMDEKEIKKTKYYKVGKTINLGSGYGMGVKTLAARLGVTPEEAKGYYDMYYQTYKVAMDFLAGFSEQGISQGFVTTKLGRRRNFHRIIKPPFDRDRYECYEDYKASEEYVHYKKQVAAVKLAARNAPVQGTAADIFKVAMLLLYKNLPEDCYVVAAIHDEVLVEAPLEKQEEATRIIKECMLKACRMFLKIVSFPEMEVAAESYWSK